MPIRFRCAYCHQLMGIARRKAGTVVSCPTCNGQVVVPQPEAQAAGQQQAPPKTEPAPGGVFEQTNFGDVFQQPTNGAGNYSPQGLQAPAASASKMDVEPVYLPNDFDDRPGGLVLTAGKLILLILIVLLLVALAFVGGLLIGRTTLG